MTKKLFTKNTYLLMLTGLALNIFLVWMTKLCGLPLYLDSIGTVLTAALGGALPGIAVGFLSNCVTAMLSVSPDPMTLYYGFLSVLIAAAAAWLSRHGLFLKWYGCIIALFAFSFIGGALGSVVTWVLYGFSFGEGVSAPLATLLFERFRFGEFAAQFSADMAIDLADKLVTVAVLCTVLYLLPLSVIQKLPLGYVYASRARLSFPSKLRQTEFEQLHQEILFHRRSVNTKITMLLLVSTGILSIIAVTISLVTYRSKMVAQYTKMCGYAVQIMMPKIDGDKVEEYLAEGKNAEGYAETEQAFYDILYNAQDIEYMYVYQIKPDGCHVVFDLDTENLVGETAGTIVPFDTSFPFVEDLLAGRDIPPVITNDTYGWLLTVYKPIRSSSGEVVAYAAADINMDEIKTNTYTFLINIASLLFGVMILIAMISIWYCDKRLLEPMTVLAEQAREFDFDGTHKGNRVRDRHVVKTGDELEEIFRAMCRTEDAIAVHVETLQEKNLEISHMQRNIIYTLANMVENRDGNTGGHIRRTANYVKLIGTKLLEAGIYPDVVNENYVKQLYDSAPLHDIGKIKISDAILNKPGRLTQDEFTQMKEHTVEGKEILRSSLTGIEDQSWLSMAIDMAAYHHEKWDGSGYTTGIAGEKIPLCARIMAVSDVFDALVSKRSYKEPFSYEEAMKIITEGAGSHFDPQIVAVFVAAKQEVLKIMNS